MRDMILQLLLEIGVTGVTGVTEAKKHNKSASLKSDGTGTPATAGDVTGVTGSSVLPSLQPIQKEVYQEKLNEINAGTPVTPVTADIEDGADTWLERWKNIQQFIMAKRGLSASEAAREATKWLLVELQNQMPCEMQPDPETCAHCGQPFTGSNGRSFLTGGGHAWIHQPCHAGWTAARTDKAKSALQSYGIVF